LFRGRLFTVRVATEVAAARLTVAALLVWTGLMAWAGPVLAQGPVAKISSPQPGATVREVVVITGTALHPRFSFYKVEYAVEPGSDWVVIGDTHLNQVQDGVLTQWDTRAVPDGSYSLRLLVVDETGNYVETTVRQVVVSNATPTETPTPEETPTETPTPMVPGEGAPPAAIATAPPTVEILVQRSPTATAAGAVTSVALPTTVAAEFDDGDSSSGTIGTVSALLGGMAEEVVSAVGIDFGGLSSAFVRGATLAVGAFVVVGVLALVRQILMMLYHLIRR